MIRLYLFFTIFFVCSLWGGSADAATSVPFTINMSESVNVTGNPRISVDVGGQARYATYSAGTGTSALTFTYTMQPGDLDLDGVSLSSPIDLNGGTIKDLNGNDAALTFTVPNTSNVKINYPSLGMDFVADADGRYTLNGTVYNDLSSFLSAAGGSFSRNSVATYFDSAGTMQTAGANQPRFDYDPVTHAPKGILIEEQRTNSLRNGNATGSAAGTPGTLPTYWGIGGAGFPNLTREVVGSGQENGVPYVDLRVYGTPTVGGVSLFYFDATNFVPAVSGQTWTASAYVKIVGGGLSNTSVQFNMYERNSSGSSLAVVVFPITPTSTLTRFTNTQTLTNGLTAYVISSIGVSHTSSAAIDITLRVGGVQLEQGAFATTYIPTTSATVTRVNEVFTVPTGAWYDATQGSLMAQYVVPYLGGNKYPGIASIDNGTSANSIGMALSDGGPDRMYGEMFDGGATQFGNSGSVYSAGTNAKHAVYYASNAGLLSTNGTLGTFDNSLSVPSVSTLRLGALRGNNDKLNGTIEKFKYYPVRVSNTQLQLLTQ